MSKCPEFPISHYWSMPNKNTFSIPPIKDCINRHIKGKSIDPFANNNTIAGVTNDIDPSMGTTFNLDALDFLKQFEDSTVDTVLFDPPFSPRQVSECYKKMKMSVNMQTTQSSFWGNLKKEISRVLRREGICITCGWNSGGVGKKYGMEKVEILMVAHGGWHNDTIVTVERKV